MHEPERIVAIDSNGFADPRAFSDLRVPEDENLILSFHFYDPLLFTHYRAPWSAVGVYEGPIDYPGELVSREELGCSAARGALCLPQRARVRRTGYRAVLSPGLALAEETGLPLWCGELGALGTTPEPARARWYRDVLGALARHRIPWTVWDYKGEFGVFDSEGRPTPVHRYLSEAMTPSGA